MPVEAVGYEDGAVRLIDQTRLPDEHVVMEIRDLETLCEAIRVLRVRGAPAIGVAAAYGFRLMSDQYLATGGSDVESLRSLLRETGETL
ncbi:MAG: S-methyl-5-thioribose-1-phosphate isomerase, partial [Gammaproteobacteria bacterium]|nr:S-methyl-5-thioribose-1-phosphate isomerase [Gammaproteobacteria bacterium]